MGKIELHFRRLYQYLRSFVFKIYCLGFFKEININKDGILIGARDDLEEVKLLVNISKKKSIKYNEYFQENLKIKNEVENIIIVYRCSFLGFKHLRFSIFQKKKNDLQEFNKVTEIPTLWRI